MNIDKYINDGQDPKVVEKLLLKLQDMLTSSEDVMYIAVQKKPAVTLFPDSIALTNKRIFLCEFTKLGLTTDFEIIPWAAVKDISFKEDIFGSKFIVIPMQGDVLTVGYIPKTQSRKLYQLASEMLENQKKEQSKEEQDVIDRAPMPPLEPDEEPMPKFEKTNDAEDELTLKLKKLKTLFERQLITQAEYESKKNELLSQL
ncbi:PH domain-containing protein [Parapedobacter tibetensis]|uniref:PH domain-containing protein n=1 Tax=Parapedobacter tibetensis TaxID=2972951 RepID=UPI00214DE3E0|nr:PH domain-containing protein [Parapedobacter tibetensis]